MNETTRPAVFPAVLKMIVNPYQSPEPVEDPRRHCPGQSCGCPDCRFRCRCFREGMGLGILLAVSVLGILRVVFVMFRGL